MVPRSKAAPPDDWGEPSGALLLNVYGNEQALILRRSNQGLRPISDRPTEAQACSEIGRLRRGVPAEYYVWQYS